MVVGRGHGRRRSRRRLLRERRHGAVGPEIGRDRLGRGGFQSTHPGLFREPENPERRAIRLFGMFLVGKDGLDEREGLRPDACRPPLYFVKGFSPLSSRKIPHRSGGEFAA